MLFKITDVVLLLTHKYLSYEFDEIESLTGFIQTQLFVCFLYTASTKFIPTNIVLLQFREGIWACWSVILIIIKCIHLSVYILDLLFNLKGYCAGAGLQSTVYRGNILWTVPTSNLFSPFLFPEWYFLKAL